jgi:hypothetical protein
LQLGQKLPLPLFHSVAANFVDCELSVDGS